MSIPVVLVGKNGQEASINPAGELVVSPGPYDLTIFNELAVANTAYNYYSPRGLLQFVLTGFIAYGDKQVSGVTNATVVIYEASAPDTLTVDRVIVQFEIGQNQSLPYPSVRILNNFGVYINAKTDDDDVHLTILGHYVDLKGNGETQ